MLHTEFLESGTQRTCQTIFIILSHSDHHNFHDLPFLLRCSSSSPSSAPPHARTLRTPPSSPSMAPPAPRTALKRYVLLPLAPSVQSCRRPTLPENPLTPTPSRTCTPPLHAYCLRSNVRRHACTAPQKHARPILTLRANQDNLAHVLTSSLSAPPITLSPTSLPRHTHTGL